MLQIVPATGAVIGIKEFNGSGIFNKYPFVWSFILIVFALFVGLFTLSLKKTPFKLVGYLKEKSAKQYKTVQLTDDFSLKTKSKIEFGKK